MFILFFANSRHSKCTDSAFAAAFLIMSFPMANFAPVDEQLTYQDVLEVFVRVNSGGTVLTKSDLVFSTVIINSPANPTGAVISEPDLAAIADACAKRGIIRPRRPIQGGLTVGGQPIPEAGPAQN